MDQEKKLPELLLPAGNIENLQAAIQGGADAIYLGVKSFNARGRAKNFTYQQLYSALQTAKKYGIKIYVTLNVVIKNREINELIETLHTLNQIKPDAIIIQDWGVYYIAKRFFPNIALHASTQMAIHNSQGVNYAAKLGFDRVIVARELTFPELRTISEKAQTEIELFIHGALCYSFSGMCLYSSYMGGQGANRGLCKQPCRRIFHQTKKDEFPFNLKDLQAIELIPELKKINVHSLKVEGRLKSANYTFLVAKAYKMAISDSAKTKEAKALLEMDMGRDKTGYFLGGKVTNAISDRTATGYTLGEIISKNKNNIRFSSNIELEKGDRLRFVHKNGTQTALKIKVLEQVEDSYLLEVENSMNFNEKDKVYLASRKDPKLKIEIDPEQNYKINPIKQKIKSQIFNSLINQQAPQKKKFTDIYVRINDINWIKKIQFNDIYGLFIQLPLNQIDQLKTDVPFIQNNLRKIYFELPAFIAENNIEKWKSAIKYLKGKGIKQFVLNHLSQKNFINPEDRIIVNENVYTFNDAAIQTLKSQGIHLYIYPLENDLDNIKLYKNKDGIQPVYFKPRLFFSRMPVKIDTSKSFTDDYNTELHYLKRENLNYIYPEIPVSFSHHVNTFKSLGITRFLIDFSYENPSQNRWKTVIKRIKNSEQIQPASSFNIKQGLT
jgi:putative protease